MAINLTIKGGTTRTYPQQGDSDLYGTATNWAQDVTNAINNAPTYSEAAQYDAIVGSAADVTNGLATHSDIATAITAVNAGERIFLLDNTFEPTAQIDIDKALTIVGQGDLAVIEGDNIATGAVVKLSATGITLENFKIIQGSGTPDYAIEFAAAIERCNINIKADGTFATALYLNGTVAGANTGTITYDTNSVTLLGESIEVEQIKIEDQTTPAQNLVIESDSDTDVLTADRTFTIDVHDGDRTLDMSENLTIGNGYNVTITAEDAASSITLDEQSFEVEGEGTATRLFKLVNAEDAARTVTFHEDLTIADGADITLTAEDAAGSITLDNASFEVEDTVGSGNTFKMINATDDASRSITMSENLVIADGSDITLTAEDAATSIVMDNANFEVENTDGTQRNIKITSAKAGDTTLTLQENLTVGDGYDVTITAEDAASSIVLDEQTFEVEGEGTATRLFKLVNGEDAARTLTFNEDLTVGDGADITLTAEDAAGSITLDNCSLEVEDTIGSGNTIKFVVGTDDASRTVTLSENLTIGDGADVTITAEDAAGSITLDEQNFEVEGEGTAVQLTKIVNANNAAATLTLEGTASVIDQDLTADSTTAAFDTLTMTTKIDTPITTNDSADCKVTTTTSGDVELNVATPGTDHVRISGDSATNATSSELLFGDSTGGDTGFRNNNATLEYQIGGAGWVALTGAASANAALDNLAGVAINTSLISDTDITDDLGSSTKAWRKLFIGQIHAEVSSKAADYTITDTDGITTIIASGAGTDITLPTPGDNIGRIIIIKRDDSANQIRIVHDNASDYLDDRVAGTTDLHCHTLVNDQDSIQLQAIAANHWKRVDVANNHYESAVHMDTNDTPAGGTDYGWKAGSAGFVTIEGGKALTESGAATSAATRFNGNRDCGFDGANTYYSSADAAFNFTGDVSMDMWVYRASWAAIGSSEILISRSDNVDGWYLYLLASTDTIAFFDVTGSSTDVSVDFTGLSAGWHHIAYVRDSTTSSSIYIDGLLLGKTTNAAAMTAAGNLEIGSYNGGNNKFTGRIDEVWIDVGNVWTAAEVKKRYAAGSRRFQSIDADGIVQEPSPLEGEWFSYTPTVVSSSLTIDNINTKYCVIKKTVNYQGYVQASNTGDANDIGLSLPITVSAGTDYQRGAGNWIDASVFYNATSFITTATNSMGLICDQSANVNNILEADEMADNDGLNWNLHYEID